MILTKIRYGTTAPTDSVGADGDLFLNSTTGDWYIRTAGVYTLVQFGNSTYLSTIGTDLYLFYSY